MFIRINIFIYYKFRVFLIAECDESPGVSAMARRNHEGLAPLTASSQAPSSNSVQQKQHLAPSSTTKYPTTAKAPIYFTLTKGAERISLEEVLRLFFRFHA